MSNEHERVNVEPGNWGIWPNWFQTVLPADPGGPLTAERIQILRRRAAGASGFNTVSRDDALIDALDALEDERDRRLAAQQEVALLRRVIREGVGWLLAEVDAGKAAAIQADRALVLCTGNHGAVPPVPCAPRRWWTHAAPPMGFDRRRHEAALRALTGTTATPTEARNADGT